MARNDDYASDYRRQRRTSRDHYDRDHRDRAHRTSHSSRIDRRRSHYRTDSGISQAKLDSLNEQLGYSSSSPSRTSPPRSQRPRKPSTRDNLYDDRPRHPLQTGAVRHLPRQRGVRNDYDRRSEPHKRKGSGQPLIWNEKHHSQSYRNTSARRHFPSSQHAHQRHKSRRRVCFIIGVVVALAVLALIIGLAVGLTVGKHHTMSAGDAGPPKPSNTNLGQISPDSIPQSAKGTNLDPYSWYDTTDFNVTYTDVKVGGLSVMGLNSSWNDHIRANPSVPFLDQPWDYGKMPIRGVNIGGWLSTEPFIKPSLFNATYPSVVDHSIPGPPYVDEWSLTTALGHNQSNAILDKHYSEFASFSTFANIRDAGFDHVRIPFPYWAITTYPGDPYIGLTAWRYLLRGIEYARTCGLRVNLDLHAAPGSQNGWNHSGRQGPINWLNGTQGQLNGERTLQIHSQLADFFGQPRYANVITMYGILNEPRMDLLDREAVVNWTSTAIKQLRQSPLSNSTVLVISNGFLPIPWWHNALPDHPDPARDRILLDAHQYVIFNADQVALNHSSKLDFACNGWSQQAAASSDVAQGFGTFLCGEWSQADTDCGRWLNGVNTGTRWEGSLDIGTANQSVRVLEPSCPLAKGSAGGGFQQAAGQAGASCSCNDANSAPGLYSDTYKKWLRMFADAQIRGFERGWGWFYWTWEVEDGPGAAQLSWRRGIQAGTLPKDVSVGAVQLWDCNTDREPDWVAEGLPETY